MVNIFGKIRNIRENIVTLFDNCNPEDSFTMMKDHTKEECNTRLSLKKSDAFKLMSLKFLLSILR